MVDTIMLIVIGVVSITGMTIIYEKTKTKFK